MFSRPVQVADLDWEIEVPTEVIEKGDEAVVDWIMTNRDKLKQLSTFPETYTIKEQIYPQNWNSWEVTICPAINIEECKIAEAEADITH